MHDFWRRSRSSAPALGVFSFLAIVLLGPGLWGGQALFTRDVLHYYWPTREFVRQAFAEATLPLWNPASQSGLPGLADIHAAALYPFNLLYQVVPFATAYVLLSVFHLVVLMMGTYAFARRLSLERGAAITAGIAFGLSGYIIGLVNMGPLLAGAAWLPWVLTALATPTDARTRCSWAGGFLALQALSGDPQSALFTGVVVLVWITWSSQRLRHLIVAGSAAALGALIAAVQLVPALLLFSESTRGGAGDLDLTQWAFHPLRVIEFGVPYAFGDYLDAPFFWAKFMVTGPGAQPFAYSVYLGGVVLLCAFLGAGRDRLTGIALTVIGAGLLLALGNLSPAAWLLGNVPPFSMFRYTEKYVLLVGLGAALLAGNGIQRLQQGGGASRRVWGAGGIILAGLLAASWLPEPEALLGGALEQWFEGVAGAGTLQSALFAFRPALWHVLGPCVLFWLLALLTIRVQVRGLANVAIIVLSADLLVQASRIVWFADEDLYAVQPLLAAHIAGASPVVPFRFIRNTPSLVPAPEPHAEGHIRRRLFDVVTLKSNLGGIHGLEEASGYGAVSLARWQTVALGLHRTQERLAEIFNTCVGIESVSSSRFRSNARFEHVGDVVPGVAVFRFKDCLPRIRTVERVVPAVDVHDAVALMKNPALSLASAAVVEGTEAGQFRPGSVTEASFVSDRIAATVDAPAGGSFVVLANSYHSGWTAAVDGTRVRVYPTNGATLGVFVPEGRHRIEWRYMQPGLIPGAVTTAMGLCVCLALGWLGLRSRRNLNAPEDDPGPGFSASSIPRGEAPLQRAFSDRS